MDHGDPADADHHDMLMKPKGINIFQADLMKSENDSACLKEQSLAVTKLGENSTPPSLVNHGGSVNIGYPVTPGQDPEIYIKYADQDVKDQQELQTILDHNTIKEYVTEENQTE
jgi:hypothetical protein